MARPTFDPLAGVFLFGVIGTEDQLQQLRDNAVAARQLTFAVTRPGVSSYTTTAGSWATMFDLYLPIPDLADYTGIARQLTLSAYNVATDGGTTGECRLQDNAGATVSNVASFTGTTPVRTALNLALSAGWAGTWRLFNVQMQRTAGSGFANLEPIRSPWAMDY